MDSRLMEQSKQRLILALDVPDLDAAASLLDKVDGQVGMVKVGLELYCAHGPDAVALVRDRGYDVFLDLKLHDIPATVARAVRAASRLGVAMLTVHTGGGRAMLAAAQDAAGSVMLLGVTVLTSMGAQDLSDVGVSLSPRDAVLQRATLAAQAGIGGLVCSAQEVAAVRAAVGPDVRLVTPGIRPAGSEVGDQKRVATPLSAIRDGADYLVVGRPIRDAADPGAAARDICAQIAAAAMP